MVPMDAIALNKQMAMLNKDVARMAMKQKMAKYLERKSYWERFCEVNHYLAAFFVHSWDLHPALALLCSCKSFKDFKGLWVLQASQ